MSNHLPTINAVDQPTSLAYIWRSCLYGFLSAVALYSGYFLGAGVTSREDIRILVAFFLACLPFFVAYSAVFTSGANRTPQEPRATFFLTLAFALVAGYAIALKNEVDTQRSVSPVRLISLSSVIIIFWLYGGYLLWRFDKPVTPVARHQLVWSVLLAIGVTLYAGILYPDSEQSLKMPIPLLLIASTILISEIFRLEGFAILLTCLAHIAVAIVVLTTTDYLNYQIAVMFACIVVAAYCAVFESWAATAFLAANQPSIEISQHTQVGRYYNATLVTLIVSSACLPIVYILSPLSPRLLVFGSLHSISAFLIWFAARHRDRLKDWPWRFLKILMGSSFLVVLAAGTRFFSPAHVTPLLLPKSPLLYALLALLSAPVFTLLPNVLTDMSEAGLAGLLASTSRFLGLSFYLSAIGVGICIMIYSSSDYSPGVTARATHSCVVYLISWLLSGIYIAQNFFQRPRQIPPAIGTVIALGALVRALTAVLIGCAVVGLGVSVGVSLGRATFSGIPFILAAMGAFALNDYCDIQRDRINRPYRPLPRGSLRPKTARDVAICLLGCSGLLSLIVASSVKELSVYLLTIVGSATYNVIVARLSTLKNAWTGLVCALPITVFSTATERSYALAGAVAIYVCGRELLMDVVDQRGDALAGVITVAQAVGENVAGAMGFGLMLMGVGVFITSIVNAASVYAILVVMGIAGGLWSSGTSRARQVAIYALWLPFLIGSVSLWYKT